MSHTCSKCKQEAKIPCHKLDGRILCFDCYKNDGGKNGKKYRNNI